jgi:hypothetical protein
VTRIADRLTDGREIHLETDEPVEQFAQIWKAALKDCGVVVVGVGDVREYIAASQIVSIREA